MGVSTGGGESGERQVLVPSGAWGALGPLCCANTNFCPKITSYGNSFRTATVILPLYWEVLMCTFAVGKSSTWPKIPCILIVLPVRFEGLIRADLARPSAVQPESKKQTAFFPFNCIFSKGRLGEWVPGV